MRYATRHAAWLLAATLLVSGCAVPQGGACPADGRDLPPEALYGNWEARIDGESGAAKLTLSRHPEYAGVRGTVTRGAGAVVSQVAGDIDDEGMLNLDESLDGRAISGVWAGELQAGSCGKVFKGTWKNASDDSTHPFVLNKIGSSQ